MKNESPDPRPGFYYVSVVDDRLSMRLVRGPFPTHEEALGKVEESRTKCEEIDPWAAFYAFGTVRAEVDQGPGILDRLDAVRAASKK